MRYSRPPQIDYQDIKSFLEEEANFLGKIVEEYNRELIEILGDGYSDINEKNYKEIIRICKNDSESLPILKIQNKFLLWKNQKLEKEKKNNQELAEKMNLLMKESPYSIFFKSVDGRLLYVSRHLALTVYTDWEKVKNNEQEEQEFLQNCPFYQSIIALLKQEPDQEKCIGIILKEIHTGKYTDKEIFGEETFKRTRKGEEGIIATGITFKEIENLKENGKEKSMLTIKSPYFNNKGEMIGFFGMARDITEQEEKQQKNIEIQEQLLKKNAELQKMIELDKTLMDATTDYIFMKSVVCGAGAEEWLKELKTKTKEEIKKEIENMSDEKLDILRENISFKFEKISLAEAKLLQNHHVANATRLTDEITQEIYGFNDFKFFHPKHAYNAYKDELIVYVIGEEINDKEEYLIDKEGNEKWVSVSKKLKDNMVIGISRDITERKKMEIHLRKAKEDAEKAKIKAEESDRLKSAFLANMSHEIRTPLNAIVGFSNILGDSNGAERKEWVQIINNSSAKLLQLINDIIDMAKIESGQMTINNQEIYIDTIFVQNIRNEVDMAQKQDKQCGNKEIEYQVNIPKNCCNVFVDPLRVREIFTNIFSNACKFVPQGDGQVKVDVVYDNEYAEFKIRNNGPKIEEDKLEKNFENFVRDESPSYRGTGIGLSISRKLATLMGGKIRTENDKNESETGVSFHFTLPVVKNEGANIIPNKEIVQSITNKEAEKKLKNFLGDEGMILIAEDESYNQELLLQYMTGEREYNMSEDRIIIVNNGKEALDAVKKNEKIKVILMDVRMPGMNGYEATREIRTILKDIPDRKIKIIGQTAHAYSGDKQDCIAAGMDAYIAKPILMPKLNETIIHVVDSEDLTPDTKN